MASSLTWTLLLCAASLSAAAVPKTTKIVGGESTTVEKYPSIVAVEFRNIYTAEWSQNCAGSILTSRYVLSAAHCFEGIFYIPALRRIRAGSTYPNTGGVISNVVRAVNHPSYGVAADLDIDISVVEIETPLVWSETIQPGKIIAAGTELPDNTPVVHAGWGRTSQGGSYPPDLQHVTIYTVNRELCASRYWDLDRFYTVTSNMICAGLLDVGGKGACNGDSGGPLYYGDIIVGVVSWSVGCARAEYPSVSAAVAPHTDWIVSVVESG